jgi:hypothetical protein
MESEINDVDDEVLDDAAFELNCIAEHASWTDQEYADGLRTVSSHLREKIDE